MSHADSGATSVDVAIVGAGIIGCLVAREIVDRAPRSSVLVLDRDLTGGGASRRSAGLHFPRGATRRVREMTALSQDYYEKLLGDDPSLPIRPLRMSVLASGAAAERIHETYLDRANLTPAAEPPTDLVTAPPGTGNWTGEGCHHADVGALVAALTRELRPRVTFHEGVAVTAIEPSGAGVLLRLGTQETLRAARVVLAPGPWVRDPAWRALVEPLGVRVKRVVALHLDRAPSERDGVIVFQNEDAFLLPMVHRGHWLFSYTNQDWDVDPDARTEGLSEAILADGRACLRTYAPELARLVRSGRVFCDAYSPSREPLVRALDDDARIVFAGAANGSGYRLAPAIAAEAADLLRIPSGQGSRP